MKNLRLTPDFHKPHAIVKAEFAFDKELIALVKSQKGKVKSTGNYKRVNPNTSRHRQTLLGHTSLKATEIYPHVGKKSLSNSMNPLDQLVEMQHADN